MDFANVASLKGSPLSTSLTGSITPSFQVNEVNSSFSRVIKKKLTKTNLNLELHGYRMETDKLYSKDIKALQELRPKVERKLKQSIPRSFQTAGSVHEGSSVAKTLSLSSASRENLGCLGVHPHNYDSLIGYRKGVPIVNNQKTLQGVRRVLNYLTQVINAKSTSDGVSKTSYAATAIQKDEVAKMELLVILDNVPNLDTAEGQNNYLSLLTLTIARIKALQNLVILPKTMKEAIRYLTSRPTIPMHHESLSPASNRIGGGETSSRKNYGDFSKKKLKLTRVGTNAENLCGVLMINPAKSKLSELANLVFAKDSSGAKKNGKSAQSGLGAIGSLCAKKGIPLISLCDVSSPLTYCTYPIICNTRNLSEVYLVLDLLSYGLNHAASEAWSPFNSDQSSHRENSSGEIIV